MTNENKKGIFASYEGQTGKKQKEEKKKSTLDGVVCTPSGSPIAPVYKRVYVEELGRSIVKQVDETNLQEFIQASKSQTDLATLQKRFLELGEIPSVNPNLVYDETAIMPSDIHQVYDMVNNVSSNFAKLPESVRNVFGTKEAYLEALLNGTYQQTLLNAFYPKENNEKKEGNEQ